MTHDYVDALLGAVRAAESEAEQLFDAGEEGSHHLVGFLVPPREFMELIGAAALVEGKPPIETVWSTDEERD